jgi:hypothetical protein
VGATIGNERQGLALVARIASNHGERSADMASSSGDQDFSPALDGAAAAQAQRELTACMEAAVAGELTSGHWTGDPRRTRPADPIASYRVVVAVPDLYRALEDGLSTWMVGKGPSGQLVSCSLPRDPGNPNGREAWLGAVAGRPHPSGLTVEYRTGGIGSPNLDGTGGQVYATTLIGRCPPGIARVTAHYQGQEQRDAQIAQGVWFSQFPRGTSSGPMVVCGYDADGHPVAQRFLD